MTLWGNKRCKKNPRAPKSKKQLFIVYKIAAKRRKFLGVKKVPTVFGEILRFPRFFGSHGFKNLNATLVRTCINVKRSVFTFIGTLFQKVYFVAFEKRALIPRFYIV